MIERPLKKEKQWRSTRRLRWLSNVPQSLSVSFLLPSYLNPDKYTHIHNTKKGVLAQTDSYLLLALSLTAHPPPLAEDSIFVSDAKRSPRSTKPNLVVGLPTHHSNNSLANGIKAELLKCRMFFAKFSSTASSTVSAKLSGLYQRISSQSSNVQEDEVLWAVQQQPFLEDLDFGHQGALLLVSCNLDLFFQVIYARLGVDAAHSTTAREDLGVQLGDDASGIPSYGSTPRGDSVSPRVTHAGSSLSTAATRLITLKSVDDEPYKVDEVALAALRVVCGRSPGSPRALQSISTFAPTQRTHWGDIRSKRTDAAARNKVIDFFVSGRAEAWIEAMDSATIILVERVFRCASSASVNSSGWLGSPVLDSKEALLWCLLVLETVALMAADTMAAIQFNAPSGSEAQLMAVESELIRVTRVLVRVSAQCLGFARGAFPGGTTHQMWKRDESSASQNSDVAATTTTRSNASADPHSFYAHWLASHVYDTRETTEAVETLVVVCGDCRSIIEAVAEVLQLLICRHRCCSDVVGRVLGADMVAHISSNDGDDGAFSRLGEQQTKGCLILLRHALSISFVGRFPACSVGEGHLTIFLEALLRQQQRTTHGTIISSVDLIAAGLFGSPLSWTEAVCGVDDEGKGIALLQDLLDLHVGEGSVGYLATALSDRLPAKPLDRHVVADELDINDAKLPLPSNGGNTVAGTVHCGAVASGAGNLLISCGMHYIMVVGARDTTDARRRSSHRSSTTTACAGKRSSSITPGWLLQPRWAQECVTLHRLKSLRCFLAMIERRLFAPMFDKGNSASQCGDDGCCSDEHVQQFIGEFSSVLDDWCMAVDPLRSSSGPGEAGHGEHASLPTPPLVTSTTLSVLILLMTEASLATMRGVTTCLRFDPPRGCCDERITGKLGQLVRGMARDVVPRCEGVVAALASPCQDPSIRAHMGKLAPAVFRAVLSAIVASSSSSSRISPAGTTVSPIDDCRSDAMKLVRTAYNVELRLLAHHRRRETTTDDDDCIEGLLLELLDDVGRIRCGLMGLRGSEAGCAKGWFDRMHVVSTVAHDVPSASTSCPSLLLLANDVALATNVIEERDCPPAAPSAPSEPTDLFAAWGDDSASLDGVTSPLLFDSAGLEANVFPTINHPSGHGGLSPPEHARRAMKPAHHRTLSATNGVLSPTTKDSGTVGGTLDLFAVAPVSWE